MEKIAPQTSSSADVPARKLYNVHALRALAVTLVILVHSKDMLDPGVSGWLNAGYAGAHLFFVISGFIMVYITSLRRPTPWPFIKDRILRIVPLYWLATLFAFALVHLAPSLFQATQADTAELFKSLFFIPFEKTNGRIHPLVFVGWSLNYEMFFYLLFGLGLFFKSRQGAYSFVALFLVLAVGAGFLFQCSNVFFRFYTNPILLEFLSGMLLGIFFTGRFPGKLSCIPPWVFAAAALAWILAFPLLTPESHATLKYGPPAFLLVLSALIYEKQTRILTQPLLQLVATASYSIFLSHYYFTGAGTRIGEMTGWSGILLVPATLALATAAGIVLYKIVEKPLTLFLKGYFKKENVPA